MRFAPPILARWLVFASLLLLATPFKTAEGQDISASLNTSLAARKALDLRVYHVSWDPSQTKSVVQQLASANVDDVITLNKDRATVRATPDQANKLKNWKGVTVNESLYRTAAGAVRLFDSNAEHHYHSYDQVIAELTELAQNFPDRCKLHTDKGKTVHQRVIPVLEICDRPGEERGQPEVIILGCHHAREWISVEIPLLFAKDLVTNNQLRSLASKAKVWIVPMVNPDGHTYSMQQDRLWRKNLRPNKDGTLGVDLNRNYSVNWGGDGASHDTTSYTYCGTGEFSEPETQMVRDFVASRKNHLRGLLTYHSFSQLILYPWGYKNDSAEFPVWLADKYRDAIKNTKGGVDYSPKQASALYLASGDTTDWVWKEFRKPAMTIELRPGEDSDVGFNLPERQIAPTWRENRAGMLAMLAEWTAPEPHGKVVFGNRPTSSGLTPERIQQTLRDLENKVAKHPTVFAKTAGGTSEAETLAAANEFAAKVSKSDVEYLSKFRNAIGMPLAPPMTLDHRFALTPLSLLELNPIYAKNARKLISQTIQKPGRFFIVDGLPDPESADDGGFPDCVAVGARGAWCCTGTLIAPNAVLTAGHCRDCADFVYFGTDTTKDRTEGVVIRVKEKGKLRHPDYGLDTPGASKGYNDLTVLILSENAPASIKSAKIVNANRLNGDESVRIVGFGDTKVHPNGVTEGYGIRRRCDVPILSLECKNDDDDAIYGCDPGKEFVCGNTLGRSSCHGDSGGPIYVRIDEQWYLLGATSGGLRQATKECGEGVINVRVDRYRDWIMEQLKAYPPAMN